MICENETNMRFIKREDYIIQQIFLVDFFIFLENDSSKIHLKIILL